MSTPQAICEPTCTGIGIRNSTDAFTLLEAVRTGVFPLRRHRLSQAERDNLSPGQVFVWTESSESSGLERWTDGRKWSASRTRDVFLIYEEREEPSIDESVEKAAQRINTYFSSNTPTGSGDLFGIFAFPKDRPPKLDGLMKQTFSAWVNDPGTGQKVKWHLSAYLSRQGPSSLPSISEHSILARIRVPNGVYECCTGPRKNRRGSRPQQPPPAQTANTAGGYHRGSSVASSLTAVESEPSPIALGGGHHHHHQQQQYPPYHQHHQQRLLEQEQQHHIPPSTSPIRASIKSEMNSYDSWDQQQFVNDTYNNNNTRTTMEATIRARRSPSSSISSSVMSTPLSMTRTLSPPTSGTTTPRTMSSSSLCGMTVADRDRGREYERERERERDWERRKLPNILASRSRASSGAGFMDERGDRESEDVGAYCYYMTPSPTDSASSPSVTPSPTIHPIPARPYPPPHSASHNHTNTRDRRSTSVSSPSSAVVSPLFNNKASSSDRFNHSMSMSMYRPSSPSPTPPPPPSKTTVYHPTQTANHTHTQTQMHAQEPHPFRQRLPPSSNSIGISVGGGGVGGVVPHYSLRSDTDSKAVAAFRPF